MKRKKRGRKKNYNKIILFIFFIVLIFLFISFLKLKIKVPIFRAPPSFHEFYGYVTCSNYADINGKVINATVLNTLNQPIHSTTNTISNNFYSLLTQGSDSTDTVKFYIDNIEIASFNYAPFGYQEQNLTITNTAICVIPSTGGGSYGGGGGSSEGGGGSSGPITTTKGSLYITSTPSSANVYINNIFRGLTPLTISNLDTGITYAIVITKQDYQNTTKSANVLAGITSNINVVLTETKLELPQVPQPFNKFIANKEIKIVGLVLTGLIVLTFIFFSLRIKKVIK